MSFFPIMKETLTSTAMIAIHWTETMSFSKRIFFSVILIPLFSPSKNDTVHPALFFYDSSYLFLPLSSHHTFLSSHRGEKRNQIQTRSCRVVEQSFPVLNHETHEPALCHDIR